MFTQILWIGLGGRVLFIQSSWEDFQKIPLWVILSILFLQEEYNGIKCHTA